MAALPTVPEERDQGAVQMDEQMAAAAPPDIQPTPAQADEQAQAQALAAAEKTAPEPTPKSATPTPAPPAQQPSAQQPPTPNMWRIPTNYGGVLGKSGMSLPQRLQDIGQLWQVLASDGNVDPLVRSIAGSLVKGD